MAVEGGEGCWVCSLGAGKVHSGKIIQCCRTYLQGDWGPPSAARGLAQSALQTTLATASSNRSCNHRPSALHPPTLDHSTTPPAARHEPLPNLRFTSFTMAGRGGGNRNKVLLPPINFIFKLLQTRATVQIWLFEQIGMRIEGKIRVSSCTSWGIRDAT